MVNNNLVGGGWCCETPAATAARALVNVSVIIVKVKLIRKGGRQINIIGTEVL